MRVDRGDEAGGVWKGWMRASRVKKCRNLIKWEFALAAHGFRRLSRDGAAAAVQGQGAGWAGLEKGDLEALRAFETGVGRYVHIALLGERLELASGGPYACVLSWPYISDIREICRSGSAKREADQRVGIGELQGVQGPSAVHLSCSWGSTQPGCGGQMLAGGGALVRIHCTHDW